MTWGYVELAKDEAKRALEAAAFPVWPEGRDMRCIELAQWLVYLDDPTIPEAVSQRRRITMTAIIERARKAVGEPRLVVHSYLGFIGADHVLEDALALVDRADTVGWTTSVLRHDLFVAVGDCAYLFDVRRPEREAERS